MLQCLFALPPLAEFFVSKAQVEAALNPSNPLGTGGELAKAFCGLVKNVAGSGGKTQVPKLFKQVLGNCAPRFANDDQQDAMEFFNTLTDLLHEDLNRVLKKPCVRCPVPRLPFPCRHAGIITHRSLTVKRAE